MNLTLKDVATIVGLVTVIGGAVIGYFVFRNDVQHSLKAHAENDTELFKLIEKQAMTDTNLLKIAQENKERLIRLEERMKRAGDR